MMSLIFLLFAMMGPRGKQIQRPKDAEEQKKHYSGKKKAHTVKNILLENFELFIQFLGKTHPGTIHDERAADENPYPLPQGSHLLQDLGFLGLKLEGVVIEMPIKKPKGGELTDEQKVTNQALAQRRVRLAYLTRRCRYAASKMDTLHTGMYLIGCTYNFCFIPSPIE